MTKSRRSPPPWSVEDNGGAFVVKDGNGQKLGCFYYEEQPGRRAAAKMLTRDEARRALARLAKPIGPGGRKKRTQNLGVPEI